MEYVSICMLLDYRKQIDSNLSKTNPLEYREVYLIWYDQLCVDNFPASVKEEKPLLLKSDMSVLKATKVLEKFIGENIPILDDKKRVIGIISENDILKAYNEISISIRKIEKN